VKVRFVRVLTISEKPRKILLILLSLVALPSAPSPSLFLLSRLTKDMKQPNGVRIDMIELRTCADVGCKASKHASGHSLKSLTVLMYGEWVLLTP
jgi:hypothetical protein